MIPEISQKPIIVVLGMHRSGTSLTTRALQVLGVDLGDHLLSAIDGDNDKGFWEDSDINVFDHALLEKVSSSWDSLALLDEKILTHKLIAQRKTAVSMLSKKMKSAKLFGFKDPRTAILLPFWQTVFHQLELEDSYVIAIRNPISIANSLLKRNNIPLEGGILLWAKHMRGVFMRTQGKRRVVVDYDLMLKSPSRQVKRIASTLILPFDKLSQQRLDLFKNEFLNQNLRHHKASLTKLKGSKLVPEFVKDAYNWMLKLAKDEIEFDDVELKAFWERFDEMFCSFNSGYQYIDRLTLSLHQYENENKDLSNELLAREQDYLAVERNRDSVVEEFESIQQQLLQSSSKLDDSRKNEEICYTLLQQTQEELGRVRELEQEYQALYQHAVSDRDTREKSYQSLHEYFKQVVAEKEEIQVTSQKYVNENIVLHSHIDEILNSNSWRLTRGFRMISRYLIKRPIGFLRKKIFKKY